MGVLSVPRSKPGTRAVRCPRPTWRRSLGSEPALRGCRTGPGRCTRVLRRPGNPIDTFSLDALSEGVRHDLLPIRAAGDPAVRRSTVVDLAVFDGTLPVRFCRLPRGRALFSVRRRAAGLPGGWRPDRRAASINGFRGHGPDRNASDRDAPSL